MTSEALQRNLNAAMERAIAAKSAPSQIVFYAGTVDGVHYGKLSPSDTDTFPLEWRLLSTPLIDTPVACAIAGSKRIAVGFA